MDDNKKLNMADVKAQAAEVADALKGELIDVEFEGYKFKVDTGLLDDVDALDLIDKIENQSNMKAIVDFLQYLIGPDGYEQMKAYFVKKEGRFKISKLTQIYVAIFEKFDPKD